MSRRSDGSYKCDRDGTDIGNAGIDVAVPAVDLDENGIPITYHFCRVNGCAKKVLSARNLADYRESSLP
jgi:hypothetical protein